MLQSFIITMLLFFWCTSNKTPTVNHSKPRFQPPPFLAGPSVCLTAPSSPHMTWRRWMPSGQPWHICLSGCMFVRRFQMMMMIDDWWLVIDDWWLMVDDWWLMIDDWSLVIDDWWLMIDDWWLIMMMMMMMMMMMTAKFWRWHERKWTWMKMKWCFLLLIVLIFAGWDLRPFVRKVEAKSSATPPSGEVAWWKRQRSYLPHWCLAFHLELCWCL